MTTSERTPRTSPSPEPVIPVANLRRAMRLVRPLNANQLHGYVRSVLGFNVPRGSFVAGHRSPFDYLQHAFFEDQQPRDCIVWANRGGGKTQLGAIATLLDMFFKPGIQIRILGGSFDQSSKMYRYLRRLIEQDTFIDLVRGNVTGRAVELHNGSRVEVLSQSEKAIRGQRVHKLRCDEVELFDRDVWDAAQLVTRSGWCGETFVHGSIEVMSTMHRPFGLMAELIEHADRQQRQVFKWSVLETIQRCPPQRPCETCAIVDDCRGRAKHAAGFIAVDDVITQHSRVEKDTWQAEMICSRPSRSSTVYPMFDPEVHINAVETLTDCRWIGGIDFGYRDPTVLLWAVIDPRDVIWVVDELIMRERTVETVIEAAAQRPWPRPEWIGGDPAGHQRNDQTGSSTISIWRRAGWPIRTMFSKIEPGIVAVARRLQTADGNVRLFIHPRCRGLREALQMYHYDPEAPNDNAPVKDGPDHAADALRYLIVNHDLRGRGLETRVY